MESAEQGMRTISRQLGIGQKAGSSHKGNRAGAASVHPHCCDKTLRPGNLYITEMRSSQLWGLGRGQQFRGRRGLVSTSKVAPLAES